MRTVWCSLAAALLALLAACSSSSANGNGGALVCAPDGSCPTGFVCVYPVAQGCDAPALCIVPPDAGACTSHAMCACGGGLTSDCGTPGYAPVPVAPPDECPTAGDGGGG